MTESSLSGRSSTFLLTGVPSDLYLAMVKSLLPGSLKVLPAITTSLLTGSILTLTASPLVKPLLERLVERLLVCHDAILAGVVNAGSPLYLMVKKSLLFWALIAEPVTYTSPLAELVSTTSDLA